MGKLNCNKLIGNIIYLKWCIVVSCMFIVSKRHEIKCNAVKPVAF